jgi:hypothetical protein
MVHAQLLRRRGPAAILALVPIPGENVSAIKPQGMLGDAIVPQQANHAGNLNLKTDAADPIILRSSLVGPQFTDLEPRRKVVIRVLALLDVEHFRQLPTQQPERASNVHHVNGGIVSVQDQDAGKKSAGRIRLIHGDPPTGN